MAEPTYHISPHAPDGSIIVKRKLKGRVSYAYFPSLAAFIKSTGIGKSSSSSDGDTRERSEQS